MEFFYLGLGTSAIITTAIGIATFFAFKHGYKAGLKVGTITKVEVNREEPDEKKMREIKRRQEGLENIMNYDYDKAIERGVK